MTTDAKLSKYLSWLIVGFFWLLPFSAFLTVWLSSLVGGYTALRLWPEYLLAIVSAGALYLLARDQKLRRRLSASWLARLSLIYIALVIIWALIPMIGHNVGAKAAGYGLIVNLRFLVFFLAVWVVAAKSSWLHDNWRRWLLGPAAVVAAIAVAQYLLLPYDFMKHFGYGPETIGPYETINHNLNHLRVMSTLRGANPLGAYLILPLTALAVLIWKERSRLPDKLMIGGGLLLALIFSFSRSAWIGAALSLLLAAWLIFRRSITMIKKVAWGMAGLAVVASVLVVIFRDNRAFQNIIWHTDDVSKVDVSSNQGHVEAFKTAGKDIINEPWGKGVGTAGPQSYYNDQLPRVAENYYLQLGQEIGVLGMALFVAINLLLARQLWLKALMTRLPAAALAKAESRHKREVAWLSVILLGSLLGISFVNLLSHAWTDVTLAYTWWGLAAVALSASAVNNKLKLNKR